MLSIGTDYCSRRTCLDLQPTTRGVLISFFRYELVRVQCIIYIHGGHRHGPGVVLYDLLPAILYNV